MEKRKALLTENADKMKRLLDNLQRKLDESFLNMQLYEIALELFEHDQSTSINKEREGGQIDRFLLKNIVDIFVEVGLGKLDHYEQDFEIQMLDDTTNYYKSKGTIWIKVDSFQEYLSKALECLRKEKNRVSHYLHSSTWQKLYKVIF
ncbi:cullin-like protein 3 [Arachis ipaensis]|uniref:cullin-like protein 3 n=1 Tax=Arachis ipaensis TaxID=130454 RepID=UPI0007AF336D|nr:cullin-like protein 3 [Arachis ipaensis]XP_025643917.1 cullin-like protein 3 [Arachis hypogaea]XP_029147367.1 cullin-like protein 3 [Arachis hypogaea]QHO00783.1 Cullin [Arachis hypogaea]